MRAAGGLSPLLACAFFILSSLSSYSSRLRDWQGVLVCSMCHIIVTILWATTIIPGACLSACRRHFWIITGCYLGGLAHRPVDQLVGVGLLYAAHPRLFGRLLYRRAEPRHRDQLLGAGEPSSPASASAAAGPERPCSSGRARRMRPRCRGARPALASAYCAAPFAAHALRKGRLRAFFACAHVILR